MERNKSEEDENTLGLMIVPEAAEFLRMKISTIRAWILRRKITYIKLGGKILFRKSDLEALLEKSVINPL